MMAVARRISSPKMRFFSAGITRCHVPHWARGCQNASWRDGMFASDMPLLRSLGRRDNGHSINMALLRSWGRGWPFYDILRRWDRDGALLAVGLAGFVEFETFLKGHDVVVCACFGGDANCLLRSLLCFSELSGFGVSHGQGIEHESIGASGQIVGALGQADGLRAVADVGVGV